MQPRIFTSDSKHVRRAILALALALVLIPWTAFAAPPAGVTETAFTNPDPENISAWASGSSIDGDRMAVTAWMRTINTMGVLIYERDAEGDWALVQAIPQPSVPELNSGSHFGRNLALDGDDLLVGGLFTNSVFFYRRAADGNWNLVTQHRDTSFSVENALGYGATGLALENGVAAVSLPISSNLPGVLGGVRIFVRTETGWDVARTYRELSAPFGQGAHMRVAVSEEGHVWLGAGGNHKGVLAFNHTAPTVWDGPYNFGQMGTGTPSVSVNDGLLAIAYEAASGPRVRVWPACITSVCSSEYNADFAVPNGVTYVGVGITRGAVAVGTGSGMTVYAFDGSSYVLAESWSGYVGFGHYGTRFEGDTLYVTTHTPSSTSPAAIYSYTFDADGDGLAVWKEIRLGTDANDADTDGDLFSDGAEVAAGSDPTNPGSIPTPAGVVTIAETDGMETPVADDLAPL